MIVLSLNTFFKHDYMNFIHELYGYNNTKCLSAVEEETIEICFCKLMAGGKGFLKNTLKNILTSLKCPVLLLINISLIKCERVWLQTMLSIFVFVLLVWNYFSSRLVCCVFNKGKMHVEGVLLKRVKCKL